MCYASLGKIAPIENIYPKTNIVFLHVCYRFLNNLKHDCVLELPIVCAVIANVKAILKSMLMKIRVCLHHICWVFTFLSGMYPGT